MTRDRMTHNAASSFTPPATWSMIQLRTEWFPDLSGNLADVLCSEGRVKLGLDEVFFVRRTAPSPHRPERDPSFARQARARFPDKSGNQLADHRDAWVHIARGKTS